MVETSTQIVIAPRGRTKDVRNFPHPALLDRIPQRYDISVAHEFLRGKKNLTRHLSNLDLVLSELAARDTADKNRCEECADPSPKERVEGHPRGGAVEE